MTPITSDIVEAYSLCPRKAFLLLMREPTGVKHEYVRMIEEQEAANRQAYRTRTEKAIGYVNGRNLVDLIPDHDVILDVAIEAGGLEARCDAVTRSKSTDGKQNYHYEPVKIIGTQPKRIRVRFKVKLPSADQPT